MRLLWQGKSLKQELQRQQKVLAAARERETTLQTRLSETSSALQAAEDSQRQQSVSALSFEPLTCSCWDQPRGAKRLAPVSMKWANT